MNNVPRTGEVSLAQLLSVVGQGMLEQAVPPPEPTTIVRGVSVLDPLEETYQPGHMVLAVGVDPDSAPALQTMKSAGAAKVPAVVFRKSEDRPISDALRSAATAAGVAVLFRTPWLEWTALITGLRAGLASSRGLSDPVMSTIPLGDLDAAADITAVEVGGAVTIEDIQSRVLAYSSSDEDVDAIRKLTILGRRVPEWRINAMQESGFFRALWGSEEVVHRPAHGEIPERLVIALRAGGEILGSIWVAAPGSGLPADASRVLKRCATAIVPHLLYHQTTHGSQYRLLEATAKDFLEGRCSADLLAERGQIPVEAPAAVLSVEQLGADASPEIDRRVPELLTAYLGVQHCKGVVVRNGPKRILVVLADIPGTQDTQSEHVSMIARSMTRHLAAMGPDRFWIGIGEVVSSLRELRASRRSADLALRALRFRPSDVLVGNLTDLADQVALVRIQDALEATPFENTSLDLLIAYDAQRGNTALVDTLRAYLDCFGNVPKAAEMLGYHPNSFRYRLTKLQEIGHLDLGDPDTRLLAQIQLRFAQQQPNE
jgi:hypothetical protein